MKERSHRRAGRFLHPPRTVRCNNFLPRNLLHLLSSAQEVIKKIAHPSNGCIRKQLQAREKDKKYSRVKMEGREMSVSIFAVSCLCVWRLTDLECEECNLNFFTSRFPSLPSLFSLTESYPESGHRTS